MRPPAQPNHSGVTFIRSPGPTVATRMFHDEVMSSSSSLWVRPSSLGMGATRAPSACHRASRSGYGGAMPTKIDGIEGLRALVGQHIGYSDWHEITQDQVNKFADATGDHQWIHVDVE